MHRLEALRTLLPYVSSDPVITTCGLTSREFASLGVRDNCLYMLNSMGLPGAVGIGLALGSGRRTWVVEGDGGLLMGLSLLATGGYLRPKHLVLVVLDNGAHCSTGCQPTASTKVSLGALARAAGWHVLEATSTRELKKRAAAASRATEPVFIYAKISTRSEAGVGYFQPNPATLTDRFMRWLHRGTSVDGC